MEKIRILLVDDHVLMRMGVLLATQAQPDMEIVGEADDVEDAVAAYEQHHPSVVLVDFRLAGGDGPQLISRLRERFGRVRCLVLSNYASGDDVLRAMQAGAAGYILKGMPLEALLAAIRDVHAGKQHFPREIAARVTGRVQSQLTDREIDVLRMIARGNSNKEAAAALDIAESTVKIHISAILQKLGAADRTQAALIALRQNILEMD